MFRAPDLASRWLFEVDVESLLISAAHNHERKGGPEARVGKQRPNESDAKFQARCYAEKETLGVHDIAVMKLSGILSLAGETEITSAHHYGGNMDDMVPITMSEGKVGEHEGREERERDLQTIRLKSPPRPFRDIEETREIIRGTPACNYLPHVVDSGARSDDRLKLLGWPCREFVDPNSGLKKYLYDGSIFAADGSVVQKIDCILRCDITNSEGGSGGPALDKHRRVTGILSMGNDDRRAMVVPVHYGLALVESMLKETEKRRDEKIQRAGVVKGEVLSSSLSSLSSYAEENRGDGGGSSGASLRSAAELAAGGVLLKRCDSSGGN